MSYKQCTHVTPLCPVEATTYGYYPAIGPNSFFLAAFSVLCLSQLVFGLWKRVYSFSFCVSAGCLVELLGYAGRLIQNDNPWDQNGLKLNIVCLIIAPTLTAAGIYLTFRHIVLHNGPEFSRLKPVQYTRIFISCDVSSIILQAIGGGLAAAAKTKKLLDVGNGIIIAGIAFQVFTMVGCGLVAVEYLWRLHKKAPIRATEANIEVPPTTTKHRVFQGAVLLAYTTVLTRCIYRIPEMAGGWGNPLMQKEKEFLLLDGMMILLASTSLTVFHPGFFYPQMSAAPKQKSAGAHDSSESNRSVEMAQESRP